MPWLAALLGAYLLFPILAFIVRLAGSSGSQLSSPGAGAALLVSVETATVATAIAAALGIPLAYLLARGRSRTAQVVGIVVQLPIALPPLMSGILLLYVLGPYTTLGRLFGGRLTDDRLGIVLAQLFVAAPFLVVAARSSFAALDPALDDVAATLGHGPLARFTRVAVPAALPGIGAGLMLAWLRGFGEFGATIVLAYHPYSLPVQTFVEFGSTGLAGTLLPTALALGTAAALITAVALATRYGGSIRRPASQPARHLPMALPSPPASTPMPLDFDLSGQLGDFTANPSTHGPVNRLAIIGASGAGKTFTLRMIAGLAHRCAGRVQLGHRTLTTARPETRQLGYVPQDSALLPRRTVWQQVTFGVGTDPPVAAEWLSRLGIEHLASRRPEELSGGQRRRVALTRALARRPDLLLLDEPFTGLDTPVRHELRREIRAIQRETGVTTVVVTHDFLDAVLLAEHVMVLDEGDVLQLDTVEAVRDRPAGPRVARLLGIDNVYDARVNGSHQLLLPAADGPPGPGTALDIATGLLPPPESHVVCRIEPTSVTVGAGPFAASIVDIVDYGDHHDVDLLLSTGTTVMARLVDPPSLTVGSVVPASIDPAGVGWWLPAVPEGGAYHPIG